MPVIILKTEISAPIEVCFNLSRSIDIHVLSTSKTEEKAVAGRTSGLIELGETVTWRAKHFGIWQHLTSKITEYQFPDFFVDEMQEGAFTCFVHKHSFSLLNGKTIITDHFDYTSPLGFLGRMADRLFLESYMRKLLYERNICIKSIAESGLYQQFIPVHLREG